MQKDPNCLILLLKSKAENLLFELRKWGVELVALKSSSLTIFVIVGLKKGAFAQNSSCFNRAKW